VRLSGDNPPHVEAPLASGSSAAKDQIVDRVVRQLRNLGERGVDDLGTQVVGSHLGERSLDGPPDGGADGGDDGGFESSE
jgi:hypothetical protein